MITPKLTDYQRKHLKTVQWLVSNERVTGRTFVLAWAFVEKAMKNKGELVRVFDHEPWRAATENLIKQIRTITTSLYPDAHFVMRVDGFTFTGVEDETSKDKAKENTDHQNSE